MTRSVKKRPMATPSIAEELLTSPTRTRQGAHEKGGNALGATRKQLLSRTSVKIIGLFDGKINPCRAKSVQFRMSAARELMVVD